MINIACGLILGARLALGFAPGNHTSPQIKVKADGIGGFVAYRDIGGRHQIVWKRAGNKTLTPLQFGECRPIALSSSWLVYRFMPKERGLVVERVEVNGKSSWKHVFRQGGMNEGYATILGSKTVLVVPPSYGPVWGPRDSSSSSREARANIRSRAKDWRVIALDIKSGRVLWDKPELSVGNPIGSATSDTFWSLRLTNAQEYYELKKPRYRLELRKQLSGNCEVAFQLPSIGHFADPVRLGIENNERIAFSLGDYTFRENSRKKLAIKTDALHRRAWMISGSKMLPLPPISLRHDPKN